MFQGFSQETVDFMWGIRFNNERGWFMEHKADYQDHLCQPMKELGTEVQARMLERFPHSGLNLKISRIYRDARRLFGRGPYKDHLWFTLFRGEGADEGARPALWFELTPDGWSYGMGFWVAKPVTMAKFRARVDRDPDSLLTLVRKLDTQREFVLDGPDYSKLSHPAPCGELDPWYRKKSLALSHDEPLTEAIYSPGLADKLVEGFSFLMPYYDYFATLWAEPDPRTN